MKLPLLLATICATTTMFAQQPTDTLVTPVDTAAVTTEEYVYDTTATSSSGDGDYKTYCNNSVVGLSPTKIISLGYDCVFSSPYNSQYNFAGGDSSLYNRNATFAGGFRFSGNIPIVSRLKWLVNFGFNYWRAGYRFKSDTQYNDFFGNRLRQRGLNNLGLSLTLFKPLNNRHFIIVMAQGEVSGDYTFKEMFGRFKYTRGSYTALFGWKKREDKLFAVGVSRTWRGGESLPIPVILWNQTFNSKWGIELLLPARGAVRYNFSPRSLLLLGYELEGSSYNMQFAYYPGPVHSSTPVTNNKFELRRSEIRARLTWEKSLTSFIWLSMQAGARINYRNAVAFDSNQGRGNFVVDNNVGIGPYGIISINLVTP